MARGFCHFLLRLPQLSSYKLFLFCLLFSSNILHDNIFKGKPYHGKECLITLNSGFMRCGTFRTEFSGSINFSEFIDDWPWQKRWVHGRTFSLGHESQNSQCFSLQVFLQSAGILSLPIGRRIISSRCLSWQKREAVGSEVHSWSQVFQDVFLESWRENRSEGLRPCTTSSRQNTHLDFTRSLDIHHLFNANYSHTAQDLLLTPEWC